MVVRLVWGPAAPDRTSCRFGARSWSDGAKLMNGSGPVGARAARPTWGSTSSFSFSLIHPGTTPRAHEHSCQVFAALSIAAYMLFDFITILSSSSICPPHWTSKPPKWLSALSKSSSC